MLCFHVCKKEIAILPLSHHSHQTVGDIGHHTNHQRQAMLLLWVGVVFRAITDVSSLPNPLQIHSTGGRTDPTFDDGKHLKQKELIKYMKTLCIMKVTSSVSLKKYCSTCNLFIW